MESIPGFCKVFRNQKGIFVLASWISHYRWGRNRRSSALDKTGLAVYERPRLLSDNGSCYVSGDLKEFLAEQSITHVRGKPLHPQTQGKIERYHRTMKNIIKLQHYYSPGELEAYIAEFVNYYNNQDIMNH